MTSFASVNGPSVAMIAVPGFADQRALLGRVDALGRDEARSGWLLAYRLRGRHAHRLHPVLCATG
jgi:hypothetical protein